MEKSTSERTWKRMRDFQLIVDMLGEKMKLDHFDMGYALVELGVTYAIVCRKCDLTKLEHRDALLQSIQRMYDRAWERENVQEAFSILNKDSTREQ